MEGDAAQAAPCRSNPKALLMSEHGGAGPDVRDPIRSIAIISSIAFSLANFRGPLIEALVAAGVRVYALAPDHDDRTRDAMRRLGAEPVDISLDRTGMHPARDALDAIRLVGILRRLKPDATFAYFIKPVIYGSLAAKRAGVGRRYALVAGLGYVFTQDGRGDTLKRRLLRAAASALYRAALRVCDLVYFNNDEDIAQFVGAGLVARERVRRIAGTGVDLERLPAAPPVTSPPTFLLMARLLREKGIGEYVAAARIVRARHPDSRFLLLGGLDPNPGGFALEEVAGWAAEGVVEWAGHVDDVRPWIARSSVYVLPSYREGKPRSTQEAMAMGRPVVTTDAPGCRDTVEEGVNGFLVPVRNVRRLAEAMLRFVDEPGLIARMGAESRRIAEERFDVREINRIILGDLGIPAPAPGAPAAD